MARYRGPVGKVSRRLGFGITEKGERILKKRPTVPGMHGHSQVNRKQSDYSLRLAEKQKARYIYGLLEKQFRRTFEEAKRQTGETGANFFSLLERRLDNVVYRMGIGSTRAQARQLVNHGHIMVDGHKTDIASYSVKVGQVISLRPQSRNLPFFKEMAEGGAQRNRVPGWISFDAAAMSGTIATLPRREDAEPGINDLFIVEFYSR
ncbi:SSU ribosomal protein S4P [Abditibacterium utsteinense]|uniref:Small ribosomal subunit protein uS4 n=1 Tax=Abditibacterium utsteinense TaxID=1960156 RepID=A0A2S8ST43_9BACT|nr:30S ribosomal protein S4 [Abditibacterium utsteinense]PQV63971.1 SSU ribosomal protein S4P [Abditibacterium utsteinense]